MVASGSLAAKAGIAMVKARAAVLLRSEPPVMDRKFDLMRHPNVKCTPDGGAAPYRMPDDYAQTAQTISPDVVTGLTEPAITDVMYDEIQKIMEEIHDEQERNL